MSPVFAVSYVSGTTKFLSNAHCARFASWPNPRHKQGVRQRGRLAALNAGGLPTAARRARRVAPSNPAGRANFKIFIERSLREIRQLVEPTT